MKQRLVGAIVLGCLAIIFIPILLDGEGITAKPMTRNIPPAPSIPQVPEIEAIRPVILADTAALDIIEGSSTSADELIEDSDLEKEIDAEVEKAEPIATERPQLGQQGLPETWSVRLASFGEKANAQALVKRLVDSEYKAYSRLIDSSQGPLTAVYVGPVLTRSDAGFLQIELEDKYELKGIVVEFIIEEMAQ